jgi:hypothetical protein
LSDLEHCATDRKAVAYGNDVVGQSFNREVLSKLSGNEVGPLELLLPITIRLDLVYEHGALFTSVTG